MLALAMLMQVEAQRGTCSEEFRGRRRKLDSAGGIKECDSDKIKKVKNTSAVAIGSTRLFPCLTSWRAS